jgi:hypothetical protein
MDKGATMSGYARIHRSLIGHPAFRNDAEGMAFAWMVLRASWKPIRVRYKGRAIALGRGQLAVSIRDIAEAMDRDKGWVERLFKRLKSETMIETRAETGVMVITICNYDDYQADCDDGETVHETVRETQPRQPQDTEQRIEKGKNINTEGSAPVHTRGQRWACPEGVDPAHWRDFLANRKRKKQATTETAYAALLRSLANFADDEWPPGRLVQHAAEKGWGTIVDPSEYETPRNGHRASNHHQSPPTSPMLAAREQRRAAQAGR